MINGSLEASFPLLHLWAGFLPALKRDTPGPNQVLPEVTSPSPQVEHRPTEKPFEQQDASSEQNTFGREEEKLWEPLKAESGK